MNIEKTIDYISNHPHFLRGHSGTKVDITQQIIDYWDKGFLNFIRRLSDGEIVAVVVVMILDPEKVFHLYPEISNEKEKLLFMPMVHVSKDYPMGISEMLKVLNKIASFAKTNKMFVREGKKHFIYTFKTSRLNGSAKYLVANKNVAFEV